MTCHCGDLKYVFETIDSVYNHIFSRCWILLGLNAQIPVHISEQFFSWGWTEISFLHAFEEEPAVLLAIQNLGRFITPNHLQERITEEAHSPLAGGSGLFCVAGKYPSVQLDLACWIMRAKRRTHCVHVYWVQVNSLGMNYEESRSIKWDSPFLHREVEHGSCFILHIPPNVHAHTWHHVTNRV